MAGSIQVRYDFNVDVETKRRKTLEEQCTCSGLSPHESDCPSRKLIGLPMSYWDSYDVPWNLKVPWNQRIAALLPEKQIYECCPCLGGIDKIRLDNVIAVMARGDELTYIRQCMRGLPTSMGTVSFWYGDHAKAVFANLLS